MTRRLFRQLAAFLVLIILPAGLYFALNHAKDNVIEVKKYHIQQDSSYHHISDFQGVDQEGKSFTLENIAGKIHVAYFLPSSFNDDLCLKSINHLKRVDTTFHKQEDFHLLTFCLDSFFSEGSVDQFIQEKAIPTAKWSFLQIEKKELAILQSKSYKIKEKNTLVLVDKEGVIRGYYNAADLKAIKRLIYEIKLLFTWYRNQPNEATF